MNYRTWNSPVLTFFSPGVCSLPQETAGLGHPPRLQVAVLPTLVKYFQYEALGGILWKDKVSILLKRISSTELDVDPKRGVVLLPLQMLTPISRTFWAWWAVDPRSSDILLPSHSSTFTEQNIWTGKKLSTAHGSTRPTSVNKEESHHSSAGAGFCSWKVIMSATCRMFL